MARTKPYAERVNILKKVRVSGSWKLASVLERNGKIVRDHVLISGLDEHHPEGGYYLEWYRKGKRRRQAVGDFSEVVEAGRRKSIEVNAHISRTARFRLWRSGTSKRRRRTVRPHRSFWASK